MIRSKQDIHMPLLKDLLNIACARWSKRRIYSVMRDEPEPDQTLLDARFSIMPAQKAMKITISLNEY